MRILIVNVNTTESMTEGIGAQARKVAAEGTEIVALTPRFGAESVEGNFESYLAAIGVMDAVMRYEGPYDAVIQAGYGEHGREGLQELLDVPVVDITEAAASTAMFLGHKYSVVTTLDRAVPLISDRLKLAGLDDRCASVRASGMAVLELESDPERAVAAIVDQAAAAVTQDHAEVICLGCGDRMSRAVLQHEMTAHNPGWLDRHAAAAARPDGDVEIDDTAEFVAPECTGCGGVLKPDVVFFGESVPKDRVARCYDLVDSSDALLVLGSSLTVMSGFRFVRHAAKQGVPVVIVNRGRTRGDELATYKLDVGTTDFLTHPGWDAPRER